MTIDEILLKVEKRLGKLDEKAKEAIKSAVELAQEKLPEGSAEPVWRDENPLFDEMANLDMM